MIGLGRAKQERIIEAVRLGLEGDAAVEFVHGNGFKINGPAIARHLKTLGGRGRILELIEQGHSNTGILSICFPHDEEVAALPPVPPNQTDFFEEAVPASLLPFRHVVPSQFETKKMTLVLPSEVYEALKAASRAEGKSRNDLIVEILTSALSRLPTLPEVIE
jgi:hypothetical protein